MEVCLSWVLCYQAEISATSSSLVQKSPTESDASLGVIGKLLRGSQSPPRAVNRWWWWWWWSSSSSSSSWSIWRKVTSEWNLDVIIYNYIAVGTPSLQTVNSLEQSPSSETYWYSYETQDLITISKRSVKYSLFGGRLSHSTSQYPQIQFQKRNFNVTLPYISRSPKCYAFQVFRQMKFYIHISHLVRASCSAYLILHVVT